MIEFFKRMFCTHDWELVKDGSFRYEGMIIGHFSDYVCKKCLKNKRIKWGN